MGYSMSIVRIGLAASMILTAVRFPGADISVVTKDEDAMRFRPVTAIARDTFNPRIRVENGQVEYTVTVLATGSAALLSLV